MHPDIPKHDMRTAIGRALRIGVTVACVIAFIGGAYYLWRHGGEPMPDYTQFIPVDQRSEQTDYTSLSGIIHGVLNLQATEWIQMGVVVLILTPIIRVLLSLMEFSLNRDWIYVGITAIVFLVILMNSLEGAA